MPTWTERRDAYVQEWRDFVWVNDDNLEDCEDDDYEGQCNCYDCREERSQEITPILMKRMYDIGFIPRNLDVSLNFNGTEPDAYYEEDAIRVKYLLNDMERLRKSNNREEKRLIEEEGLTKRKLRYCWDCGTVHRFSGAMRLKDSEGKLRTLCPHCADRYIVCVHCGKIRSKYDAVTISTTKGVKKYVCGTCGELFYRKCNNCKAIKPKENFMDFPTGKNDRGKLVYYSLCNECSTKMHKCDMCKAEVPLAIIESYGRNRVCPSCGEHFTPIHRHAYSPLKMHFHKSDKEGKVLDSTLYFGFELEIESNNSWISTREAMSQLLKERAGMNRVYIVQDGSLSHGVEMVSYPFTWEKLKEDRSHWADVLQFAKSKGWESYFPGRTVGMHIHTSKAAWGTYQIYKMMSFMYNPTNRDFLHMIAQRESNQYCRFSAADQLYMKKLAKDKKNQDQTHYNVVNLNDKRSSMQAEGGPTIEFRLFSGTLEPLHFFKNLEFVYAVYCFTRDLPQKKMNTTDFVDYVQAHKRVVPSLAEFLGITKGGK